MAGYTIVLVVVVKKCKSTNIGGVRKIKKDENKQNYSEQFNKVRLIGIFCIFPFDVLTLCTYILNHSLVVKPG